MEKNNYFNNNINPKYNNYLNNDMRQYAQGGDLTRFDEGGTHESSPLGGIPQGMSPDGKQNTVEQGESKKGNFIYSNRIALDKDLVKQFNLPGYVAGKSVSDASKVIDDKFKDRSDKYAQETKKTLLDRLAGAQEYLKQQEQAELGQTNESMMANSQEIPDQTNGQIPEGMEEYAEGMNSNPQEEQMEQMQGLNPASPIAAFGGYQQKRFEVGGNLTASMEKPWMSNNNNVSSMYDTGNFGAGQSQSENKNASFGSNANGIASNVGLAAGAIGTSIYNQDQKKNADINSINAMGASVGGDVGKYTQAATGVYDMAQEAFGKSSIDTSGKRSQQGANVGKAAGSGALKGAATGAAAGSFIPGGTIIGAGIGAIVGGITGYVGGKKDVAAQNKNNKNYAYNYNSQFDKWSAYGGMLNNKFDEGGIIKGSEPKKVKNADGSYSYVRTSTRQVTPGSTGTVIPGTPGSPAVLPSAGGVNATDPGRNKAFAQARAAGLPTFNYNGKVYNTEMKLATPGRPAVNPTPATVTPSIPPTFETQTSIEPIPNQVYNIQAQRGTAGTGVLRPGIGGGITTDNQYTANQDVANRAVNAQQVYNADVNRRYAPAVDDGRSNNSAQLANRNAKAELRRQQLQGTATANEIPTQLGLERNKVEELRNANGYALGGNMNQYYTGGELDEIFKVKQNLYPQAIQNLKTDSNAVNSSILKQYNNEALNPGLFATQKTLDGDKYSFKNRLGRAGEVVGENAGDAMRLAPVAMNAYQLSQLKKPQGFQYNTLGNRFKPQYVDEAQMQRNVDQAGNNTMAALTQMGGSQGATRNAILAMGLNKTKGLSSAYANAAAQNRAQDAQAQQFNLNVDASNASTNNKAIDEMRADQGAYDSAKSKYLSSIGTDIGDIGKEKNASDAAIAMFGYTRKGKYVVDKNGNRVSPEMLARRQSDFATYISEQNKKANV